MYIAYIIHNIHVYTCILHVLQIFMYTFWYFFLYSVFYVLTAIYPHILGALKHMRKYIKFMDTSLLSFLSSSPVLGAA